jgi:hypothetical protein
MLCCAAWLNFTDVSEVLITASIIRVNFYQTTQRNIPEHSHLDAGMWIWGLTQTTFILRPAKCWVRDEAPVHISVIAVQLPITFY